MDPQVTEASRVPSAKMKQKKFKLVTTGHGKVPKWEPFRGQCPCNCPGHVPMKLPKRCLAPATNTGIRNCLVHQVCSMCAQALGIGRCLHKDLALLLSFSCSSFLFLLLFFFQNLKLLWVFHVHGRGSSACAVSQGVHFQVAGSEAEPRLEPRYCHMECGYPQQCLNGYTNCPLER